MKKSASLCSVLFRVSFSILSVNSLSLFDCSANMLSAISGSRLINSIKLERDMESSTVSVNAVQLAGYVSPANIGTSAIRSYLRMIRNICSFPLGDNFDIFTSPSKTIYRRLAVFPS